MRRLEKMLRKVCGALVLAFLVLAIFNKVVLAEGEPPRVIVVQKGDTLAGLADQYSNDWSRYPELMEVNNLTSTTIYSGQKLLLPDWWPVYHEAFSQEEFRAIRGEMHEPWNGWVFQSIHGGVYQLIRWGWIPFRNPAGWWPMTAVMDGVRCFDAQEDFAVYPLGVNWDSQGLLTIQDSVWVPYGECSFSFQSWEKEVIPVTSPLPSPDYEYWRRDFHYSSYYDSRNLTFYNWVFVPYRDSAGQVCLAIFTLDIKQIEPLPSLPRNFGEEYSLAEGDDPFSINWQVGEPVTVTNVYYRYEWQDPEGGTPWKIAFPFWEGTEVEYQGKSYLFTDYYDLDFAQNTVEGVSVYEVAGVSFGATPYGEEGNWWVSEVVRDSDDLLGIQLRDTPPPLP